MIDQILQKDQGITFGVFTEDEAQPEEEQPEQEVDENEEGYVPKPKAPPPEKLPKHIFVEEVVREPRIHYFRVPMLGSYLAIKLEYDSCLFEEAFDAAVDDYQIVA